jgi:hypothetical protein
VHLFIESFAFLRFVLLVARILFAQNFFIAMSKLALVSISAKSLFNPVLTHLSLKLGCINSHHRLDSYWYSFLLISGLEFLLLTSDSHPLVIPWLKSCVFPLILLLILLLVGHELCGLSQKKLFEAYFALDVLGVVVVSVVEGIVVVKGSGV